MYKNKRRALTRHHEQRIRDKATRIFRARYGRDCPNLIKYLKNSNNLAVCSCFMCGNPRRGNRMGDKTMQERKFLQENF